MCWIISTVSQKHNFMFGTDVQTYESDLTGIIKPFCFTKKKDITHNNTFVLLCYGFVLVFALICDKVA